MGKEDQHSLATTASEGGASNRRTNGIGRKKKMKTMIYKVGHKLGRRSGRKKRQDELNIDCDNQNVVEYSLSQFQKNAAEDYRLFLLRKQEEQIRQRHQQSRDDDELICGSGFADDSLTRGNNEDNQEYHGSLVQTYTGMAESLFNPLSSWVYPFSFQNEDCIDERENEEENDRREPDTAETNAGEEDQEREQNSKKEEEINKKGHKKGWGKQAFKRRTKKFQDKKAQKTGIMVPESSQKSSSTSPEKDSKQSGEMAPQPSNKLVRSASKSTKAIISGAKKITRTSSKMVKRSSKGVRSNDKKSSKSNCMIENESSKAVTKGAKNASKPSKNLVSDSPQDIVRSTKRSSTASKALASSIKHMIDTNQKSAASALLASVQGVIQKSSKSNSPGVLLNSIHNLIEDTETRVARNRRTACRQRRWSYRRAKAKKYKEEKSIERDQRGVKRVELEVVRNDTVVSGTLTLPPSSSNDGTEIANVIDVYQSENDDYQSENDDYQTETDFETDFETGDEEGYNSMYEVYRSDYDFQTDDEEYFSGDAFGTDTEWEDRTSHNDYTSSNSVTDYESNTDYNYDSYKTGGSSDEEYTTDATGYTDNDKGTNKGFVSEGDDDNDDITLSKKDRAIFNGIEDTLKQLEVEHENEEQWWLYRTFFPKEG